MVLASNEWLNNSEDDQKSANTANTNNTATPATRTTNTTTTTDNTTTDNSIATRAIAISATNLSATTAASTIESNDNINANNEQFEDEDAHIILQPQQQQQQQKQHQYLPPAYEETSMINTQQQSNTLKIMAENTTNEPLKIETDIELNEIENNNQATDTTTTTTTNTLNPHEITLINSNTNSNANSDSNTNTLQASAIVRQNKSAVTTPIATAGIDSTTTNTLVSPVTDAAEQLEQQSQFKQLQLSNPITPQALSNALQSVMNAATVNNLQNNFLSSLGMDIDSTNSALQQQTAKQLSSSFNALENQTNLANNTTNGAADVRANNIVDAVVEDSIVSIDNNGHAKIVLLCEAESHPFQTRSILLTPNIECKVGRLIAKSKATEANAIFDCKVLSRNHAVLWYSDDGKFWVKDTKSSNGTFINENKLGNEAAELHFGDIVKFGVTVLENSRKEVHGCIIACVKLYLPDGREAISIDASSHRSQYEGRISFDELHRLNLYMQEASQREKVLKSKLFNIQNILDATRKSSALCWQSMIAEDQLLHRIHSLEKKLQIMEKNVPESVLRNEVLKLLDDKNSYQHTAKEALRKVYQERCDAMQMLSKMESAYATSDNECKILRDQIMNTKQTLQDVTARLTRLESEYNEFKDETDRQQEAKLLDDQRTTGLLEKLRDREIECDELRRKISELMLQRANMLDEEEQQLEKQVLEKLDAAIADVADDDDDDDDEDDDEDENEHEDNNDEGEADNEDDDLTEKQQHAAKERRKKSELNDSNDLNGVDNNKNQSSGSAKELTKPSAKSEVVKESTILKWLQNSDLNAKEGSLDIFKAICNESDSSDEHDPTLASAVTGAGAKAKKFNANCEDFEKMLHNVQKNLKQLEAEIESETNKTENVITKLDDGSAIAADDSDEDDLDEDDEFILKRNGKINDILSKDNKSYLLLKKSVLMLREAYNEMRHQTEKQPEQQLEQSKQEELQTWQQVKPITTSVRTQFQMYAEQKAQDATTKILQTQATLKAVPELKVEEKEDAKNDYSDDDVSSIELTARSQDTVLEAVTEAETTKAVRQQQRTARFEQEVQHYQQEVVQLKQKLDQIESDSQNTLEIMQIECDALKDKIEELAKINHVLRNEKATLEDMIKVQQQQTITPVASQQQSAQETTNKPANTNAVTNIASASNAFEQQMREELAAMNSSAVQREEELILYKERLEQTQNDNLQLRSEIVELKLKANDYTKTLLKQALPYGAFVVAILIYFLTTYF